MGTGKDELWLRLFRPWFHPSVCLESRLNATSPVENRKFSLSPFIWFILSCPRVRLCEGKLNDHLQYQKCSPRRRPNPNPDANPDKWTLGQLGGHRNNVGTSWFNWFRPVLKFFFTQQCYLYRHFTVPNVPLVISPHLCPVCALVLVSLVMWVPLDVISLHCRVACVCGGEGWSIETLRRSSSNAAWLRLVEVSVTPAGDVPVLCFHPWWRRFGTSSRHMYRLRRCADNSVHVQVSRKSKYKIITARNPEVHTIEITMTNSRRLAVNVIVNLHSE